MLDLTGYTLTFDEEFNRRDIAQTAGAATWGDVRSQFRGDINADVGFGASSFVDAASGYDPFRVAGGVLTITAVPDRTSYGVPTSWESGLITTQGSFSQTYGYFEIRADFSNQPGAWDAFWLLPDTQLPDLNKAGRWQELDIVEHYGSWDKGVYSGIHTTDPAPNEHWQRYLQVYSEMQSPSGYHTYGMNWQADWISFYVDGQFVGSQATPSDLHGPMYLLANLATQRDAANNADAAGVPISSSIDYIRVYSNTPDAEAVALDTISSPDGRDPGLYGAHTATSTPLITVSGERGNNTYIVDRAADSAIEASGGGGVAVKSSVPYTLAAGQEIETQMTADPGVAGQISLSMNTTTERLSAVLQPEEVFRFYNTKTNGHFFTPSEAERDQVKANLPDFLYEGVGFYAFETDQGAPAEAVYRFYNAKTNGHFFTISEAERDQVKAHLPDFLYEGIGYYAFEADQGAATEAVYRFYNAKTNGHFFTVSEAERDQVKANLPDFLYEGIAFYVPDDGATFVL